MILSLNVRHDGGEGGIRTPGGVAPTQPFQGCTIDHSDTSPNQKTRRILSKQRLERKQFSQKMDGCD